MISVYTSLNKEGFKHTITIYLNSFILEKFSSLGLWVLIKAVAVTHFRSSMWLGCLAVKQNDADFDSSHITSSSFSTCFYFICSLPGKDPSPGMDHSTLPQTPSSHPSFDQTQSSTSNTNYQSAPGPECSNAETPSLASHLQFQGTQQWSSNSVQTAVTNVASSSQSTSNAQGDISKSQCLICGDFASGRHYNVVSCEGCKGVGCYINNWSLKKDH